MSSGGTGKTSDEIVFELADSILNKLPDVLDMELAQKELLEVTENHFLHDKIRYTFLLCQYLLHYCK